MSDSQKILYAFYDLAVCPVSFDYPKFLILAEYHRINLKCDVIHTVIVPAPGDGFREDDPFEAQDRLWRLRNIMIPLNALMPTCVGSSMCGDREQAQFIFDISENNVFPAEYSVEEPVAYYEWADIAVAASLGKELPSLSVTPQATRYVKSWLGQKAEGRKVISITMREMGFQSNRNSQVEEWIRFARTVDPSKYLVVLLRDTGAYFDDFGQSLSDIVQFPEALFNLEVRSALYAECYLNLMVSNGPMEVCTLNKSIRVLILKFLPSNLLHVGKKMGSPEVGVPPNGQLPVGGPLQKIFFEDDTFEDITREFEKMVARIDANDQEVQDFDSRETFPASKITATELIPLMVNGSRYKHALYLMDQPVLDDPESRFQSLNMKTRFLIQQKDFEEAVKLTTSEKEYFLSDDRFFVLVGDIYFQNNQADEAIESYRTATELKRNNLTAHCKVGFLLQAQGKFVEAENWLRAAMAENGPHPEIYNRLAAIMKEMGRPKEALEYLMLSEGEAPIGPVTQNQPDALQVIRLLMEQARNLKVENKIEEAIDCLIQAITLYLGRHQAESAIPIYYEIIKMVSPSDELDSLRIRIIVALFEEANVVLQEGREYEALAIFNKMIELDAAEESDFIRDANLAVGNIYATRGEFVNSIAAWDRYHILTKRDQGLNLKQKTTTDKTDHPIILIAQIKSASEYISQELERHTNLPVYFNASIETVPNDYFVPSLLEEVKNQSAVLRTHVCADKINLSQLSSNGITKVLVHVRDPRQATLSWVHYVRNLDKDYFVNQGRLYDPTLPENYAELEFEEALAWAVENYYPGVVEWIEKWIDVEQKLPGELKVSFSTFESFLDDEVSFFTKLYDFFEHNVSVENRENGNSTRRHGPNFRLGKSDEWREVFSENQRLSMNEILSVNVLKKFNWER